MKSERIHIRIKPEDKAKLQAVAEKKRRTITSLIEEMIVKLLEEEMATYIVINLDGGDEWISYEGTDLEKAKRIARLDFYRIEKSKQKYTVELRKMVDEYDYDLVDFIEVTWHDLSEENLMHSYYNGDGTSDLQFEVKGKTVFVRNIPTPEDADEWYWDDKLLTKEMAMIKPEQIEVR